jgi:GntR family transcriptional regulator
VIAVDHQSPLPLHVQVQSLVRGMIDQPPYREGGCLPDEISLAERLGVSRGTVRQALGTLVAEGLLERRRGHGTRRVKAPIRSNLAAFRSFSREMSQAGIAVRLIAAQFRTLAADVEVAEALGVEPGVAIIRIERVRGDDKGPIACFTSWLHPRCALREGDDLSRPLYDLIAERGGPQPAWAAEDLSAETAGSAGGADLGCNRNQAILVRRRRVFDAEGVCFERALVRYRGDRFSLQLELSPGEG